MLGRHRFNERIEFFEPGRADPFVECVNRIARARRDATERRAQREQGAEDDFEEERHGTRSLDTG